MTCVFGRVTAPFCSISSCGELFTRIVGRDSHIESSRYYGPTLLDPNDDDWRGKSSNDSSEASLIMDDVSCSFLSRVKHGTGVGAEGLSFGEHGSLRQLIYQEGKDG